MTFHRNYVKKRKLVLKNIAERNIDLAKIFVQKSKELSNSNSSAKQWIEIKTIKDINKYYEIK